MPFVMSGRAEKKPPAEMWRKQKTVDLSFPLEVTDRLETHITHFYKTQNLKDDLKGVLF